MTLASTTRSEAYWNGIFRQAADLDKAGRYEAAYAVYQRLAARFPTHIPLLGNVASLALQVGRPQECLDYCASGLALEPASPVLLAERAAAYFRLEQFEDALTALDAAIEADPGFARAHKDRAGVLHHLKRYDEALVSAELAISLAPHYPAAYLNQGATLLALKRYREALAQLEVGASLDPESTDISISRAAALYHLERYEDAVQAYDDVIGRQPEYARAHDDRGATLARMGRLEEALESCDRAIALTPDRVQGYVNRNALLMEMRRPREALAACDQAIALDQDNIEARWNKALTLLLLGEYTDGWRHYEWRHRTLLGQAADRLFAQPRFVGQGVAGKTIFLYPEQGLGDFIQFCRYARLLAERGANVILETPEPIADLAQSLHSAITVANPARAPSHFDYHSPVASLPRAFNTTVETIPAFDAYLSADDSKVKTWANRLGPWTRPRVGLVWSGGFRPDQPETWGVNARRNLPLTSMGVLSDLDLEFHSLQKGQPAEAELEALTPKEWSGAPILNHADTLTDFAETAALVANLDLVISVDTSTAHLAGALGKPVWILNRFDACWRWLMDREDSPWYPSARLFRQTSPGDWAGVLNAVRIALRESVARGDLASLTRRR